MSKPHEFFEAMAEAKAAMDKLPEIEDQLASVQKAYNGQMEQLAELQATIAKANQLNMELQDKVRSLEVERDDAGFRRLEAEDRLQTLLGAIGSAHRAMGEAVKSATPAPELIEHVEEETKEVTDRAPEAKPETPIEPTSPSEPAFQTSDPHKWVDLEPPNPTMPAEAESGPNSIPESVSMPYFGWTSFDKPMSTSWKDFLSGGGIRPSWLTDEEVERDAVARVQSNAMTQPATTSPVTA